MNYLAITQFAQSWGLLILCALFFCAVAYALWPKNKQEFDHASRLPLEEDDHGRA